MNSGKEPQEKLILALDGIGKTEAFNLIQRLPKLRWVKVGFELFLREGPQILSDLREKGLNVFLDLKFHDIPQTMGAACREAAAFGAQLITVHACAGSKALKCASLAAIEGAESAGLSPPKLLAVTVLTSWDENALSKELKITESLTDRVKNLAKLAVDSSINGCVCSPLEISTLRSLYPKSFEIVTPGIRFSKNQLGDQSRVLNPYMAIKLGASKIVVGRPIIRSNDPLITFEAFCNEIDKY